MTQEEKSLLLKDLCARLTYEVFLKIGEYSDYTLQGIVQSNIYKPLLIRCNGSDFECSIEVVRPYLRPMSSMTEEVDKEYAKVIVKSQDCSLENSESATTMANDWLLSKGFDVRGLIKKGLALEAPEGMYK